MSMLNEIDTLEELQVQLDESLVDLKRFKHTMFMKFNNTDSEIKRQRLLNEIRNFYTNIDFKYLMIHENYWKIENKTDNEELKDRILNTFAELREEINSME